MIDRVEVGRPVSPRLRVAFEVADAASATQDLVDAGAELVGEHAHADAVGLSQREAAGPRRPADHALFQELGGARSFA